VVHVDDPDAVGDVRAVIGDARVALAVEAVGGPVVGRLLELLSDGGWLVSYSWARDEPMWVDTATLVGKHLTVRGFFVGDFDYRDKVVPVIREAAPLVADGALVVPVGRVPPRAYPGRGAASPPWRQDSAESGGALNARKAGG
jgi:NADPH:quinone reductase-like Zn-dependent oxidoreductase